MSSTVRGSSCSAVESGGRQGGGAEQWCLGDNLEDTEAELTLKQGLGAAFPTLNTEALALLKLILRKGRMLQRFGNTTHYAPGLVSAVACQHIGSSALTCSKESPWLCFGLVAFPKTI